MTSTSDQGISKSANKLVSNDPERTMVIRDITPNVTTMSTPFLRFGRVKIGGRGTLVKLQTGALAIFSPVALTPTVRAKVKSMGNLKYIIAPDVEHHIFVTPWAKEFPQAEVIGPEGLPEKREKDDATKGIKFQHVYSKTNKRDVSISPEFDAEFECEYFDAHVNKELVFLHKPSRTLIEADLLFNLPATEQFSRSGMNPNTGLLTRLFVFLNNTRGDMIWSRRFLWYAAGAADRPRFADSAKRISKWDYDRIIPCHGDVIETGGKSIMERALAWYREMR